MGDQEMPEVTIIIILTCVMLQAGCCCHTVLKLHYFSITICSKIYNIYIIIYIYNLYTYTTNYLFWHMIGVLILLYTHTFILLYYILMNEKFQQKTKFKTIQYN